MSPGGDETSIAIPRVLLAGLRGSGGKTLLSLGVTAALRGRGRSIAPYKKGADYIDSAWLSAAAGRACRNLDLYMVEKEEVFRSFVRTAPAGDLAVIEGNRGLYDGMNVEGTYSSAEVAKLLRSPVVLVCDCTKTTRTLAALVLGCMKFDPGVDIKGVILNKVGSPRQEKVIREAVRSYCDLPVLGAVPRLSVDPFSERHLGLVPPQEHKGVPEAIRAAAEVAEEHVDLDVLVEIAEAAPPLEAPADALEGGASASGEPAGKDTAVGARTEESPAASGRSARTASGDRPRVAVFRDAAFQFYYPENLEALEREGAELVFSSPMGDRGLPRACAIYIGGGFPETLAKQLVENEPFRRAVAAAVESGVPVYAECAGAVYLGERLIMDGASYPMTGALPVVFGFERKPKGHGYSTLEVTGSNPFYRTGSEIKGHEFHYSHVLDVDEKKVSFAFKVRRGFGIDGERDGICRKNALATYCHIHALGVKGWAKALVRAGVEWEKNKDRG